jgi:hypothetical protein
MHHTCFEFESKPHGELQIIGEHGGRKAVGGIVGERESVIGVVRAADCRDWAEKLIAKCGHIRSDVCNDCGLTAQLGSDLEALGLDVHDLLRVCSFLDHNRPYSPPANYVRGSQRGQSSGAFAYLGQEIPADELEENLVRYLRRWAPYVGRFGLLVLELHSLPPELAAANLRQTPVVAYDGTHGFSDQYLLELPIFLECAQEARLQAEDRYHAKFPASELATVSANFFTALAWRVGVGIGCARYTFARLMRRNPRSRPVKARMMDESALRETRAR